MQNDDDRERAAVTQLAQWISGKWISHAIHTAAELGIADVLEAQGEQSLDELAARTGSHAPSLYRLMRALSSIGIFSETAPGRFASNPLGALLREGSMRAACLMAHSGWHDAAWGQLSHSIRTGESGFEKAHGATLFAWLNERPDAADVFSGAMAAGKAYRDYGIAESYDFGSCSHVVDVGGGYGSLAAAILAKHPAVRATIVDLQSVVEKARVAIESAGLAARCSVIAGDFFERIPVNGDVYVLAHVLHDWDDEDCRRILQVCRAAMKATDRLVLAESLMQAGSAPDRLKWLDLEMLVLTHGGRERTQDEYGALLFSAGLRMTRVITTGGSRSIIEACPDH